MSWQATAWAIEQQEVVNPVTRLVLLCLANYADATGANAFPAIDRLARDTRLSVRAVQYQLRKLEKTALIRRGNQAIAAAHIARADRRPVVYDLLMQRGARDAPRGATGCTTMSDGVHMEAPRGAPGAPDPPSRSSLNSKRRLTTISEVDEEIRQRFGHAVDTLAQLKRLDKK